MLSSAALGPIAIMAVPMAAVGMLGVITIMGMQFAAGKLAQMIGSTTKNTNKGIKNIAKERIKEFSNSIIINIICKNRCPKNTK